MSSRMITFVVSSFALLYAISSTVATGKAFLSSPVRFNAAQSRTSVLRKPQLPTINGGGGRLSVLQQYNRQVGLSMRKQLLQQPQHIHAPWVVQQSTVDKFKDMVGRVPNSFKTVVPDIVMKGADRVKGFYEGIDNVDGLMDDIKDVSNLKSNGVQALKFIEKDLETVGKRISSIFSQDHPILRSVTEYFFRAGGKRIRPVMVLIMARAMMAHQQALRENLARDDRIKTTADVHTVPTQIQLAQITELIHTASLFHDDIIDVSDTRRGQKTINSAYGNRVAVLSGDFLLARSAVLLAELEDPRVITGMATSIEHLCGGELLQIKSTKNDLASFDYYIEKTFYKTGSLMAYACESAAQLAGADDELVEAAYLYGGYLGIAFQIVDDLLDIQQNEATTGKPVGADMQNGHATAPVLYAMEEHPELRDLIVRRFKNEGDAEKGLQLVLDSQGIEKTKKLIEFYQKKALEAISGLHKSDARDALVSLAELVVARKS